MLLKSTTKVTSTMPWWQQSVNEQIFIIVLAIIWLWIPWLESCNFFTKPWLWKVKIKKNNLKIVITLWLLSWRVFIIDERWKERPAWKIVVILPTKFYPFCSMHSTLKGNRSLISGQSGKLSTQSISLTHKTHAHSIRRWLNLW